MSDKQIKKLRPCPFCGKDPYSTAQFTGGNSGTHFIWCSEGCGARGPSLENEIAAADAWDKRSEDVASEALRDIVMHQDLIGGLMAHYLATRRIASDALERMEGEEE